MGTESIWSIVVIAGPIILGLVLAWALMKNRRTPRQEAATEAATRQRYDEAAEERHRSGD
jgi:flagellar biosynthesis/type III secretory pathway M-ring protein FliF/YscJ